MDTKSPTTSLISRTLSQSLVYINRDGVVADGCVIIYINTVFCQKQKEILYSGPGERAPRSQLVWFA